MSARTLLVGGVFLAVALAAAAATGTLAVAADSVPAARQGELARLVRQDCGSCHGMTLRGGLGPALTPDSLRGRRVEDLAQVIRDGRLERAMPAWATLLAAAEIDWVAAGLQSGRFLPAPRGTGDLGLVVERADGAVLVVEHSTPSVLCRIEGLGDLSHASAVFSRDARFAYVFGRDGGLTRIDLLECRTAARIVQSGNAIGGAISQDGQVIAVSNYQPGGVRLFAATTLELLADIPALDETGRGGKTVGLVDVPGRGFAVSLFDAGAIWLIDAREPRAPRLRKFPDAGRQPYDAFLTPDGRTYVAGLFGDEGLALVDLWYPERGVRRVEAGFRQPGERLPVYKMPHLEGVTFAGGRIFLPAVGRHDVLVLDARSFELIGRIAVRGQPVFAVARPDGREIWVNFAMPDNGVVQVIDVEQMAVAQTLAPGPGVLHIEFTPRGEAAWVSVRDAGALVIYDTASRAEVARLPARSPSGIFFTARAGRIGQ